MTSSDVVKIVTAFIWPVIVVLIAILYHEPLTGLLRRLKSFEAAGFKGAFSEQAEKALDKADAAMGQNNAADDVSHDAATEALINQTATQPWWAAHQAWRLVRWAAKEAAGDQAGGFDNTAQRVQYLLGKGLITEDVYQVTLALRGLYGEMRAKPQQLDPAAASDFVEAAAKLVHTLRQVSVPSADDISMQE